MSPASFLKLAHPGNNAFGRLTVIFPLPPPIGAGSAGSRQRHAIDAVVPRRSFCAVFGFVGVSLLFIILVCVVWTSLLIVLTLAPNEAANLLMDTGDFDNGQFWLIVGPEPEVKYLAVAGLLIVDMCYAWAFTKMTMCRTETPSVSSAITPTFERWAACEREVPHRHSWKALIMKHSGCVSSFWKELTSINGRNRKLWVSVTNYSYQEKSTKH
jgi:hypothetical protein